MDPAPFQIEALDHVQLAMPAGEEEQARAFYSGLLGLREVPKPPNLAQRGGAWFEGGSLRLHLGVEADFRPARKAHPALRVRHLGALEAHLRSAGIEVVSDEPLPGYERFYVADPFGNRIELLEPLAAGSFETQDPRS
jgi:catechol 2,3-dioxygenase-like lactoylglutathione lyase family enzyme